MSAIRARRTRVGRGVGMLLVAVAVTATLLLAHGLARPHAAPSRQLPTVPAGSVGPTVSTAGKVICPAVQPGFLPDGITAHDRNLVPYSRTVLGVDATWSDASGARSVEVLDGGYVDDITEPYDNLAPARDITLSGTHVTVLTDLFLNRRVYLGYWRVPGVDRPCDVHALVTIGLPATQAYAVLHSLK